MSAISNEIIDAIILHKKRLDFRGVCEETRIKRSGNEFCRYVNTFSEGLENNI
ncbi:MAG: hypothetical protein MJ252_28935 [archaeon]|nr:hypothetical protein [archaeon]